MLRRWAICVWCDFTQIIKDKEESKKLIKDQGVYNFIILLLLVPDMMMKYIREWMQMVYRHMIYPPEIDKQAWQRDHGTWWLDNIDNICMYGWRTFAKNIKTLSNPHSVHDGSCFVIPDPSSRLLPAPWCCLLPSWQLTAYLSLCLGGRALPHPPHPGWPHFP